MATPHVAGVVAEMLQSTPTASPQTISTNLLNQASSNVVKTLQIAQTACYINLLNKNIILYD